MSTYSYLLPISGGSVRKSESGVAYDPTITYSFRDSVAAYYNCAVLQSTGYRYLIEHVMYSRHNVVLPDYITDDETVINKLKVSLSVQCSSSESVSYGVFFRALAQPIPSGDAADAWNVMHSSGVVATFSLASGTTHTVNINFNESSNIRSFMKNGYAIGFTYVAANNELTEGYYKQIDIKAVNVTIDFESVKLPPEIEAWGPDENNSVITDPLTISWEYSQSADVSPERFEVFYEEDGQWKKWAETEGTERNVSVYAHMLKGNANEKSGVVNVFVRGFIAGGIYGDSPQFGITVYFVDCIVQHPTGGITQLASEITRMEWSVESQRDGGQGLSVNNPPANYQIQYSVNSGESWAVLEDNVIAGHSDGLLYYDVPAYTFESGVITWRVLPWIYDRIYNSVDKGVFVVRVQASTSSVYCDGKPQPTLSWQSTAQVAYQVRFDEYDSGAVYGTEQSFTIPYFYTDGVYRVQIRTQASSGVWSPWTEPEYVTITNIAEYGEISLSVNPTRHAVAIEWNSERGFVGYILYRNGVPVYSGGERSFTDIGANGTAEYCVRGIADTGYYATSETVTVDATPKTDCMYDMDNQIWIPLKYSQAPRTRGYGRTAQVHYNYYAGRRNPVAFTEGNIDTTVNVSYLLKTREEAERILKLAGKMVLYKDTNGGVLIGIVTDPGYQSERFYPVSFTITGVDYNEAVKYEAVSG